MISTDAPEKRLDAELLQRVAQGDAAAFAQLYDRFSPALYSMVVKMVYDEKEAEDILQEGFSHIWRRASAYDPARSAAFSWAVMVIRHKAIDRLRVLRSREHALERATQEFRHFPEADETSAAEPALRERRALVRTALQDIPDEQQVAIELAFFGGLTHEEIAEKLGAPLGTIKARIRRGLLRLRDFLTQEAR